MKKIQWKKTLSVGIEPIDHQHRQWIESFNNTVDAMTSRHSREQILKMLGFLVEYTETHFSTEERYMAENHYPGLQEQIQQHQELRATLANLVRDFEDEGITPELTEAMDTFLGHWLIRHIKDLDMKFGAFTKRKRIDIS